MSERIDYEDVLNASWDNIPETKTLPVGSYLLEGRSASFQPAKEEDKSPIVLFVFTPREPMDDVSSEDLEALGDGYELDANRLFHRFYIESNADWDNVRKLLAKMGVETKGQSIADSLKQVRRKNVIGYLDQRTFVNSAGETVQANNITSFAAVEG